MWKTKDLDAIRDDLRASTKPLEKKYGIKIEFGNISYDEHTFSIKTKVSSNALETDAVKQQLFNKWCGSYGLKPTDFKRQFKSATNKSRGQLETFELVGFEPSRSKFPIKARNVITGENVFFTRTVIANMKEA